jgi:amino acid transporter
MTAFQQEEILAQFQEASTLRPNSIGAISITFFAIAFAAPLAAIAGVAPIVFGVNNAGVPGIYLICTLVLMLFSVGFVAMARERSGPGGFAIYISEAFGSRAGFAAAAVAILGYASFLAGNIGLLGYLTSSLFQARTGVDVPWWIFCLIALLAIAFLGHRDLNLSAKLLGVFLVLEVVILLIMSIVTIGKGGANGINFSGFTPHSMATGAPGIVFLLASACFVGFEATTLYGEEAKDRERSIPRATYAAVILIGLIYTLVMWTFQIGYGSGVQQVASTDAANFMFKINTMYAGALSTEIMTWLVVTSIFAACLAMHNSLARYLFALGRDGVLPKSIGKAHSVNRSPSTASHVQSSISFSIVAVFAIAQADPYATLYAWLIGVGSVAILLLFTAASFSVCFALRKRNREKRIVVTTVAPITAGIAMLLFLGLALFNYPTLTGSTSAIANHGYLLVPMFAALGWFASKGREFRATALPDAIEVVST